MQSTSAMSSDLSDNNVNKLDLSLEARRINKSTHRDFSVIKENLQVLPDLVLTV